MSRIHSSRLIFNSNYLKMKFFPNSIDLIKRYNNTIRTSYRNLSVTANDRISNTKEGHSEIEKTRGLENKQFKDLRLKEIYSDSERNWYPHKFGFTMSVSDFLDKFSSLDSSDQSEKRDISLCGRITNIRKHGKNLSFIDIRQDESIVQIKASASAYEGDFRNDMISIRRGDIIGVEGFPTVTKSGELSLQSKSLNLLAPTLKIIPSQALIDTELRYRKRHLDLLTNKESRCIFRARARILSHIRSYLDQQGFMEVETPVLTDGIGGASAAAFDTYHNDLQMKMSLRIAPELHLKSLVVGGFDRVYEIGKQFRNEGIDSTHNPEFTSCEFYMAYADYNDLLNFTEDLLSKTASNLKYLKSASALNIDEELYNAFIEKSYKRI